MTGRLNCQEVRDYAQWRSTFDADDAPRCAKDCTGGTLFCAAADPNHLVVRLAWDNADRARLFTLSDDFEEGMTRSGVIGQPFIWLLEETEPVSV